jgi:hypothetical protein
MRMSDDGGTQRPPRPAPPPEAGRGRDEGEAPAAGGGAAGTRQPPGEIGGPKGPEPTRYGDWEKGGRCTDF